MRPQSFGMSATMRGTTIRNSAFASILTAYNEVVSDLRFLRFSEYGKTTSMIYREACIFPVRSVKEGIYTTNYPYVPISGNTSRDIRKTEFLIVVPLIIADIPKL